MDGALYLLQNADPADAAPDCTELVQLEGIKQWLTALLNPMLIDIAVVLTICSLTHTAVGLTTPLHSHCLSVLASLYQCFTLSGACEQMNPMIDDKLEDIDR